MPVTTFLALVAVIFFIAAAFSWLRASGADTERRIALDKARDLEKRLTQTQEDLTSAKDDIKRKVAALEDARERAQKAKRKAEKEEKALPAAPATPDPAVMAKYAAAVEAAERRARAAEEKAQQMVEAGQAQIRKELEAQLEGLRKKLVDHENREARNKEALAQAAEQPKPQKQPELKGVRLNVKELPQPVIDELARFMRRAQNAEKMLVVEEGQRELAQDKLEELQRRYFAVCRELALVAVNAGKPKDISDQEAARLAMDLVVASEEASRRRMHLKHAPRGAQNRREDASHGNGQAGHGEGNQEAPRRARPPRQREERKQLAQIVRYPDGRPGDAKPAEPKATEAKPEETPAPTPPEVTASATPPATPEVSAEPAKVEPAVEHTQPPAEA